MSSTTATVWSSLGKVNTTDSSVDGNDQYHSRVIGLADGGFLVAWEDSTNTFSHQLGANDIVGQRYDLLGNKVGGEVYISAVYEDLNQQAPAIAAFEAKRVGSVNTLR